MSRLRLDRRQFLGASAATAAGLALPLRTARAAVSSADLKFVFVFNNGGWDPTRVFGTQFGNANVDMEASAEPATMGGITYVAHPDRPAVDTFFAAHHERTLVINGMQVRSIAHEICTVIALTGNTSGFDSDWPAIIAADQAGAYTLPHLVLGGPSFPGELGAYVARTGSNGQLEGLLSGEITDWSDVPVEGMSTSAQAAVDAWLQRRAAGRVQGSRSLVDEVLAGTYQSALDKSLDLKSYRYIMDFTGGTTLAAQAQVAADALSNGLSRCVTMGYPGAFGGLGWDSHATNDDTQSQLFEGLFTGLGQLMTALQTTPGTVGATLADETVVVVMSEMGRTPLLNATNGKDHWPYTSLMMVGPNLAGDRVIGAFDEVHYGHDVDLESGEIDDSGGRLLSVEAVGGGILALAGIDPGAHISGADPLTGILA